VLVGEVINLDNLSLLNSCRQEEVFIIISILNDGRKINQCLYVLE